MNKTFKIYGIIFGVVLILLAILELGKKEVTNWQKNFDIAEKSPFGLFIFYQQSENIFGKKLQKTKLSPYDYYSQNTIVNPQNILIIEREIQTSSWEKILQQVDKGSDAMIITQYFSDDFQDSLKFYTERELSGDAEKHFFTDKKFQKDSLLIDKLPGQMVFSDINKETEILGGSTSGKNVLGADFIKINFGKGHIYLHSEPLFITNYYLLKKGNEKYAQNVFSYLPDRETVWFIQNTDVRSQSPLRFILSKPPLRYAWWLLLAGLVLFAIFNAKRKQRIVPVIEPLKNKSVEFVKSIGNLYLQEGDFHDMMGKKAQYFLHKVRLDLMIDTQNLDESFAKKLHLKTGASIEKINEAIELIKRSQDPYSSVMKEDLIKMNKLLDEILK